MSAPRRSSRAARRLASSALAALGFCALSCAKTNKPAGRSDGGAPALPTIDAGPLRIFGALDGSPIPNSVCGGLCAPIRLATAGAGGSVLATDATSVYFTTPGAVMKVPITGGDPTTLASDLGLSKNGIAVAATNVYWTDQDAGFAGAVMRVSISGGTPEKLADLKSPPGAITADQANVYWASIDGASVAKMSLTGGAPVYLVGSQDSGTLSNSTGSIAVDGTSVFWTTSGGTLMKVAIGGGTPMTVNSYVYPGPGRLAVDVFGIYAVAGYTDGAHLQRLSRSGDASFPLTQEPLSTVGGITVDATSVYWTVSIPEGSVMRVPLAGGVPTTIGTAESFPRAITTGPGGVYWTATVYSLASIMRFDSQACEEGPCGCPAPYTLCDGTCVDTQRDMLNCGGCETPTFCRTSCVDGVCG